MMLNIEFLITIVLAFIVAFCSTPIVKRIAFRIHAVDVPKDDRRMHKKPIALFGGAAIIIGFIVAIAYNLLSPSGTFTPGKDLWGLLAGVGIIALSGIIDDVFHVKARVKLMFQIAAAFAVIFISGTRIEFVTNPFAGGTSQINIYLSFVLTLLWIVGITNAINFIDGLDGLAAGVSSISSLSLFFVSIMGIGSSFIGNDFYTPIITGALAGATLGFLPFNFNPAKIFMGETGSAFLGFTLGVISIQGTLKSYTAISIAIPLLVLGLPLFDTSFAIIRRVLSGKSPAEADRGHLHHRLIDMGLSQKQSVLIMYIASGALGLCAIVLANRGILSAIILLVSISIFVVGGAKFMSDVDTEDEINNEEPNKQLEVIDSDISTKLPIKELKKLGNQ